MAAASSEELFEVFMDLLDPLGPEVDVVLETSHHRQARGHADLYREHIDMPVLKSILYDYEDLLVNDGCLGIAVLNPGIPQEVQFDEHKLLIVYGNNLTAYEAAFADRSRPLRRQDEIHHRSRARPFFERYLLPAVRRIEDSPRHGQRRLGHAQLVALTARGALRRRQPRRVRRARLFSAHSSQPVAACSATASKPA